MILGADLDGCVHDYAAAFWRLLRWIRHPQAPQVDPRPGGYGWEFYRAVGMTDTEFARVARLYRDHPVHWNGPLIPGADHALRRFADAGWGIHIVTARPPAAETTTREWLDRHAIPFDGLTFTKDKAAVTGPDVFYDDHPATVDALQAAGRAVWLISRPHNLTAVGNYQRVAHLSALADRLLDD